MTAATTWENEGLYNAALIIGCLNALTGILFMGAGKKAMMENFSRSAFRGKVATSGEEFQRWCGLLFHVLFIVGATAWSMGMVCVGGALRLEVSLCILPGALVMSTLLLFMRIANTSIVGIPDFNGPPLPAFIIVNLIAIMFLANAIVNWDMLKARSQGSAGNTDDPTVKFAVLCVVACLVPHAFGAKHRGDGWMNGFVVPEDKIGQA